MSNDRRVAFLTCAVSDKLLVSLLIYDHIIFTKGLNGCLDGDLCAVSPAVILHLSPLPPIILHQGTNHRKGPTAV